LALGISFTTLVLVSLGLGTSEAQAAACTTATAPCTITGTGGPQDGFSITNNGGAVTISNGSCTITGTLVSGPSSATSACSAAQLAAFNATGVQITGSPGGSTGGGSISVVGTLPSLYVATTQQYVAITRLGRDSQFTSQIGVNAVHTETTEIRDGITSHRPRGGSNSFAWDPYADNDPTDARSNPFAKFSSVDGGVMEALGYAKAPIFTKAPVPLPSGVQFAIWGQGFADQEKRTETLLGADVGRTTTTYGGLGGFDATFSNFMGFGGTSVFGVLGGATQSNIRNADGSTSRVEGPGVGFYSVYVKGAFSFDTVDKIDFFTLDRWQTGAPVLTLGLTNYTSAANVNYRFDLPKNWWFEPTAGLSYTSTRWDSASKILGFQDGEAFRLQAGSRVGTSTVWGNTTVEGTLTGLAYSDVVINGGSIAVAAGSPMVPTDEGKVFGQGIGKLNFLWTPKLSSYVEGEVRGRDGVIGYAGRLGARYSFN
jgi:hypothetical protein